MTIRDTILEPYLMIRASAGSGKTYQLSNRIIGAMVTTSGEKSCGLGLRPGGHLDSGLGFRFGFGSCPWTVFRCATYSSWAAMEFAAGQPSIQWRVSI